MRCFTSERRGRVMLLTSLVSDIHEPVSDPTARWPYKDELFRTAEQLQQGDHLVIDLTRVTGRFCSASLGVLISLRKQVSAAEGTVAIVPSEEIREVLRITKLDRYFTVYTTVDDVPDMP